jgi:uncharacterized protein YndB with AHSA1/START domain
MKTAEIEKNVVLKAPQPTVWRALTDYREFGAWFRVALTGPFRVGKKSRGHITWPGYEHLKWEARIVAKKPESYFAFAWHPYAIDPEKDYSKEPPTLVEFRLVPVRGGTRLTITESGFSKLPAKRRPAALRMNRSGWAQQLKNIREHIASR